MSDEPKPKTKSEKLRDVVSQLKEMEHYSRSNLEKLTNYWMLFEEEEKNAEFAEDVSTLLTAQTDFEKEILELIETMEMFCNRLDQGQK